VLDDPWHLPRRQVVLSIFAKLFLCDFEDDYMSQFYLKML
jgi:hypothetical protein